MLSRSGAVGFEGISAGAGSRAAAILTDGLGGVDFELSLGGASPFGSEAVSFDAPVAESVDLVGIVESPATRNLATRPNVPVRRRSSLQNQSIGFPPRSQNVAPTATASLEGLGPFHIPRISGDRFAVLLGSVPRTKVEDASGPNCKLRCDSQAKFELIKG